jgi:anti-anti-sigma factor
MQITVHPGAEHVELRLQGRIDATWAEHLGAAVEKTVRAGTHQVVLDFAGVEYISSLGIRVLVLQYKLLKSVKGSLTITNPSAFCRNILTTVGLSELLAADSPQPASTPPATVSRQTRGGATYEIYPKPATTPLSCTLIGKPEKLATTGFDESDCRSLRFANGSFGLGLGAFGEGYADCKGRFGDFLAAGGCAITLPTNDPHSLPDYLIEQGNLIPQVETLYSLYGRGDFSTMIRFDSLLGGPGKIGLSELLGALVDLSDSATIAFVIIAEAAGLVGATLRKSPAGKPLSHELPSVRDWLSFTTERASEKSLALLVGIADRDPQGEAAKFLRPMKAESPVAAHVHAAVFPYRPVQRGELPFARTVADLLGASSPTALMHLMADTRPFEGVGETDLARGACWIGPLKSIGRE